MNPAMKLNCHRAYIFTSDNANLLDIMRRRRVGRLVRYFLAKSAAEV